MEKIAGVTVQLPLFTITTVKNRSPLAMSLAFTVRSRHVVERFPLLLTGFRQICLGRKLSHVKSPTPKEK